jgi:hypothetical protein
MVAVAGLLSGCFGEPTAGETAHATDHAASSGTDASSTNGATTPTADATAGSADADTGATTNPMATSATTVDVDATGTPECECPYPVGDGMGHCLPDGQCVRFVFTTSETLNGVFGSLQAADELCQMYAAGLPGYPYRAFVTVGGDVAGAIDRVGLEVSQDIMFATPGPTPRIVASSTDQFRIDLDPGPLENTLDYDENGNAIDPRLSPCGEVSAWTGMAFMADGTPLVAHDCAGWTNAAGPGSVGLLGLLDARWAGDQCNGLCGDGEAHLLCFEVPPLA